MSESDRSVSASGPTLQRLLGSDKATATAQDVGTYSFSIYATDVFLKRYITEHDAVREVLLGLQGIQNIMLTWINNGPDALSFVVCLTSASFVHHLTHSIAFCERTCFPTPLLGRPTFHPQLLRYHSNHLRAPPEVRQSDVHHGHSIVISIPKQYSLIPTSLSKKHVHPRGVR